MMQLRIEKGILGWIWIGCLIWLLGAAQGLNVYIFWRQGCPHCEQALSFLDEYKAAHPEITIKAFHLPNGNKELFQGFLEEYNVAQELRGYVPTIFLADKYFVGFDPRIRSELESSLDHCSRNPCPDLGSKLLARFQPKPEFPIWIPIGIAILVLMLILILRSRR